jgi:hypothetical protein
LGNFVIKRLRTLEELQAIKASWYVGEDNALRWLRKPHIGEVGDAVGLSNVKGNHRIACLNINKKAVQFIESNVIWFLRTGEWPTQEIDHVDRNPENNAVENLRLATRSQNTMNRLVRNKSGHKGVHPRYGKWAAQVWKDGKCHSLGVYETMEEAIMVHKQGAERLHGEFARVAA